MDDVTDAGTRVDETASGQERLLRIAAAIGGLMLVGAVVIDVGGYADPELPTLPGGLTTEPGEAPSLPGVPDPTDFPTDLPTDFPTDFPTELPSGFPTDLPTIPDLPELPGGNP